jgi:hypothetical protein
MGPDVKDALASSSNVRSTPLMSVAPPASDISITVRPPGATSRMSRSCGKVWLIPLILTVTFFTDPLFSAGTTIVEG